MNMEYITLNTGSQFPKVGFGTAFLPEERISEIILEAYNSGYRLFDTALQYGNEKFISDTIKAYQIKRENILYSTKISSDSLYFFRYHYGKRGLFNIRNFKSIRDIILKSFENLQTDYVDLFLVHWPYPNYLKMYSELTKLYHEGRIKAIGVCSFTIPHLKSLKEVSDVVPAINQFEISPLNTQKELIKYCQERGIAMEAMSTFSHFRSNDSRLEIINNPILIDIAKKHNKTVVQIVLRWLIQQDIIVIPKSKNLLHIKENIDIFDFKLDNSEMKIIDSMDQGKCLNYNPYAPHILKDIPKKYR